MRAALTTVCGIGTPLAITLAYPAVSFAAAIVAAVLCRAAKARNAAERATDATDPEVPWHAAQDTHSVRADLLDESPDIPAQREASP